MALLLPRLVHRFLHQAAAAVGSDVTQYSNTRPFFVTPRQQLQHVLTLTGACIAHCLAKALMHYCWRDLHAPQPTSACNAGQICGHLESEEDGGAQEEGRLADGLGRVRKRRAVARRILQHGFRV